MMTIKIKQDGILKKEFNNAESDGIALGWMLRHQGNSTDYAMRYDGYTVELINEETKESEFWKPYSK